ncbi:MAG TPA: hypothetical protein VJ804_06165, partial [Acidimicrobiales bacterium]|nr:hypothetical protein [Acidimicrobiales bacterium]
MGRDRNRAGDQMKRVGGRAALVGRAFARSVVLGITAVALVATAAVADDIDADADADALATPHQNTSSANQAAGTTASYSLSALIDETGNTTDNVFPGSLVVTITRSGAWLAASAGTPASFTFTSYDVSQSGTISVTVPECTTVGTQSTVSATLT